MTHYSPAEKLSKNELREKKKKIPKNRLGFDILKKRVWIGFHTSSLAFCIQFLQQDPADGVPKEQEFKVFWRPTF